MKRLTDLALQLNRLQYPSFPDAYRVIHKYTDKTANGLTKCVIDWINFNGYQAERISTMGRVLDNRKTYTNVIGQNVTIGSTQYIPGSGTKGSADISATIKGRSVKIEVKVGKDRMSEAQVKYQASVERAGGIYIVARDFPTFCDWYEQFITTTP